MRVLLTGVFGLFGSHPADLLLVRGHEVIGIDDLATSTLENFERLIDRSSITFLKHDAREPFEADVDSVLNFACPNSPLRYQNDSVRTIETNF